MFFIESEELTDAVLGKGIGVSGSALSGKAVFYRRRYCPVCG